MASDLIHDRGRGPELVGTRLTVYNLLPYFLDPMVTEAYVCKLYDLTPEQVAAMRGYIFHNLETVLNEHLRIEERIAIGNPPEVIDQVNRTRQTMRNFKKWLDERKQETAGDSSKANGFPTFREWMAEQEELKAVEVA